MLRYLETLFRHRLLLSVPAALVLAGSVIWVAMQPPAYQATVRLWVDKQQLVANPNDNPYLTPAQEQQAVLAELLSTRYFCLKVGHRSLLAKTLGDGTASRPSLPQRLLAKAGLGSATSGLSGTALDDALYTTVNTGSLVLPAGPQIVTVQFTSNNPVLAAAVAQAIADQFMDESLAGQRLQSRAAVDFYGGQVKQAQAALSAADSAVDQYLAAHPDQRSANAVPDARMVQLRRTDDSAKQRYDDLRAKLDQASVNDAALARPDTSGIRVLDRAGAPARSSIRKLVLEAGGVGLVVSLLLVVVGVLALTLVDNTFRWPEEIEQALDLRPVGTVPRLG